VIEHCQRQGVGRECGAKRGEGLLNDHVIEVTKLHAGDTIAFRQAAGFAIVNNPDAHLALHLLQVVVEGACSVRRRVDLKTGA